MPRKRSFVALGLLAVSIAAIVVASFTLRGSASAGGAPSTTTITVGDTWFCDSSHAGGTCETTIAAGDTVAWDFSGVGLPHSTRECGASCDNPTMTPLWDSTVSHEPTFQFTFNQAGTFLYRCEVHPSLMRGRIVVQGGPQPTPTATPPVPATPTPTPPRTPGDVDCRGSVNSIDAALVLQFDAGLLHSLSCPQNGDTNRDGRTNSLDAALILQLAAGLIATLPPS